MRLLTYFLLCSVFLIAGCKKNRLNQPSYLNFSWRFTQDSPSLVSLSGGAFTATQLTISGDRKEGDDIDITQSLPAIATSFSSGDALNVQVDVPVGEYLSFISTLKMASNGNVPFTLTGTFQKNEIVIPVRIEFSQASLLQFISQQTFTLKKKETHKVYLELAVSKLFQNVSQDNWYNSMLSNENGVATLVISEQVNHPLYSLIEDQLSNALTLTVE